MSPEWLERLLLPQSFTLCSLAKQWMGFPLHILLIQYLTTLPKQQGPLKLWAKQMFHLYELGILICVIKQGATCSVPTASRTLRHQRSPLALSTPPLNHGYWVSFHHVWSAGTICACVLYHLILTITLSSRRFHYSHSIHGNWVRLRLSHLWKLALGPRSNLPFQLSRQLITSHDTSLEHCPASGLSASKFLLVQSCLSSLPLWFLSVLQKQLRQHVFYSILSPSLPPVEVIIYLESH